MSERGRGNPDPMPPPQQPWPRPVHDLMWSRDGPAGRVSAAPGPGPAENTSRVNRLLPWLTPGLWWARPAAVTSSAGHSVPGSRVRACKKGEDHLFQLCLLSFMANISYLFLPIKVNLRNQACMHVFSHLTNTYLSSYWIPGGLPRWLSG